MKPLLMQSPSKARRSITPRASRMISHWLQYHYAKGENPQNFMVIHQVGPHAEVAAPRSWGQGMAAVTQRIPE